MTGPRPGCFEPTPVLPLDSNAGPSPEGVMSKRVLGGVLASLIVLQLGWVGSARGA